MSTDIISLSESQAKAEDTKREALLIEGLAIGGEHIAISKEFWTKLKAEAGQLARKHTTRKRP
jgi:hypothetical protein